MRLPFVSRARYADLYARYQLALKATADARAGRAAEREAKLVVIRQLTEADRLRDQVTNLELDLQRATADKTGECRRCEQLQQRLDQALGLDTAPVKAGRGEHTRRPTRMPLDPS